MKKWLTLLGVFTLGFVSHLYLVYVLKPDIKPTYSVSTVTTEKHDDSHHATSSESDIFIGYLKLTNISYLGDDDPHNKVVIEDLLTSKQKEYFLKTTLPYGGKITQILKDRIVVAKQGEQRSVQLLERLDDPEARKFLLAHGYKKVGEEEWLLMPDHLHLDKHVENNLLSTEISPHLIKGKQRFRIDSFPEGGLFEKLGFKPGDAILTIDDEELTDIQHILRICWKIRGSSLINVKLERDHNPINYSFRIVSESDDA